MAFQLLRRLRNTRGNAQNAEGDDEDIFGNPPGSIPNRDKTKPRNLQASILNALSDDESDMSKFLFVGKSMEEMKPRNTASCAYGMALQPLDVRTDRIILLFEAYTVFGALVATATWSIYEWGLESYGDGTYPNYVINLRRAFEFFMALSLVCNIIMALYGFHFWLHSIMYSASRVDYVYEARNVVSSLHLTMEINGLAVFCGLFIGLILKLDPTVRGLVDSSVSGWTEFGIAMAFILYIIHKLNVANSDFTLHTIPLEIYHLPPFHRFASAPTPRKREELRRRAFERAKELEAGACEDRRKIDPHASRESDGATSTLGTLLRAAAANLELPDVDTSHHEARLNREFITEEKHLRGMDVESLARYLPFRLAKEVHRLVSLTKSCDVTDLE